MRHPAFIIWASLLAGVLAAACGDGTSGTGSGTAGSNGATGTAGTTGGAGTTGQSGSTGTAGQAGTTGAAGDGATGTAGTTGRGGNGATGAAGNAGTTGGVGSGGSAGMTGSAGQGGRGGAATGQAGRGGGTGTGGTAGRGGAAGSGTGGQGGSSTGRGGTTGSAGTTGTAGTTGQAGSGGCANPPAPSELIGWASLGGGTTGGGNATPQVVTTLQQFTSAVTGSTAAVIYVNGKLAPGRVGIGSNKTIVGVCGAEIHGHLSVGSNVIVRNIKIVGFGVGDCSLDPSYDSAVGCSSGDDAITVSGAQHVWFDHCDVSDGTDGNLDVVNGSDYVTISWTKFHYTPRTDPTGNDSTGAEGHRFSNLIGSSDTVAADVNHLNITWHHDWWADNVNQRMPRSRRGKIHILNSLYTAAGDSYCSNAGQDAQLLVEGTVYSGVKAPFQTSQNGILSAPSGSNLFTSTSGTTTGNGASFGPTYPYTVEPASGVQAAVMAGAGPH
jgi:pectate lyase